MKSSFVRLAAIAFVVFTLAGFWLMRADPHTDPSIAGSNAPRPGLQAHAPEPAFNTVLQPSALPDAGNKRREGEPLSERDRESILLDKLRRMDDALAMEVVSPGWAAVANKQIDLALQAHNLKTLGAGPPDAYEAECRSSSCKLSLMFVDGSNAEDTILALTTEIGSMFPEAVIVPVRSNDGTAQYFVYASTMKSSKLLGR
jgi:hypothetical protein